MNATKVRTIAVVLGDNDYLSTFLPLMDGLKRILEYNDGNLLPEEIDLIVRQSIMGYYVGYQYRFDPTCYGDGSRTNEEHLAKTAKDLSRVRVLFDEEAEIDIATNDHDGGAWYLEVQSGTIKGY